MPLFYIQADDGNGENFDQIVEANTKDQAIDLHKAYVKKTWEDVRLEITRVFLIPAPTGAAHVLEWHTKGGVEAL